MNTFLNQEQELEKLLNAAHIILNQLKQEIVNELKQSILEQNTNSKNVEEEFITRKEAANLLKISLVTLDNYIKDKNIDVIRIGRSIRIPRNQIVSIKERKYNL